MPDKKNTVAVLPATFATILVIFSVHRALAFQFLNETVPATSAGRAFFVGWLSDIWVACLSAVLITILTLGLQRLSTSAKRWLPLAFTTLIAFGLCAHQGYVEFFKFQLEPFHLKYVTDWQFVTSNSGSFWQPANFFLLATALGASWLFFFRTKWSCSKKSQILAFAAISLLSLAAHNRNIHYRVQWFIPENLQTNLAETLYLRSKTRASGKTLTASDFAAAALHYAADQAGTATAYDRTLFSQSSSGYIDPTTKAFHDAFRNRVATGRRPIVIIALLESLRPSETGFFSPDKPSLTPTIDKLAADGITFTNAYSSGSVTRGGQEAVLCGHASGRATSLMRNYDNVAWKCLTDDLPDEQVFTFWYHGGDSRFDDQGLFWRRHQIRDLMSIESFEADVPRTSWGISDKAFFKAAAERLASQLKDAPYSIGMMLSVTNHIPWALPSDYTGDIVPGHPSWSTTRYTDQALDGLIEELKRNSIWDQTLLVLVSDHGNKVEPYNDLYANDPNKAQRLQSHIVLILSGGLTESVLHEMPSLRKSYEHLVGQTDLAETIGRIVGVNRAHGGIRITGKSLFDDKSEYPVISQTEDGIFIPKLNKLMAYKAAHETLPDLSSPAWIYQFHFLAINEYLMDLRTGSANASR